MKLMDCLSARDQKRTDSAASERKAREMSMGFFLVSVSRLIPWRQWGGLTPCGLERLRRLRNGLTL